jgi:NAD(P)-dependent dehydrogenase (short-subunit alcohol dehydrogenase family)
MPQDLFCIRDRLVVVTGGLGQLGRQYTAALLGHGAKVAILDVVTEHSDMFQEFGEQASSNLLVIPTDVTRRESIAAALSRVEGQWGVPHALINNAALDSPPHSPAEENGPFETYPESSWDQVMQVNVKGVFLCAQVIGGRMASEGRGSIVNIGSIYGLVSPDQRIYEYRRHAGSPFFKPVAYSASKSALLNLTRYLATYWAAQNVRVNTLTLAGVFNDQDAEFLRNYCAKMPLGRMARKDEYNGAVIFLVSDASSYMTGSNMILDGGWTAW